MSLLSSFNNAQEAPQSTSFHISDLVDGDHSQ